VHPTLLFLDSDTQSSPPFRVRITVSDITNPLGVKCRTETCGSGTPFPGKASQHLYCQGLGAMSSLSSEWTITFHPALGWYFRSTLPTPGFWKTPLKKRQMTQVHLYVFFFVDAVLRESGTSKQCSLPLHVAFIPVMPKFGGDPLTLRPRRNPRHRQFVPSFPARTRSFAITRPTCSPFAQEFD